MAFIWRIQNSNWQFETAWARKVDLPKVFLLRGGAVATGEFEKRKLGVNVYPNRWILVTICLVFTSLFTGQYAAAQTSGTGTISGTITDPSGAAIAAATVDVRDADTGIVHSMPTDAAGLYYAPFLQIGHYEVSATKEGFARVQQKDILLQVGSKLTVNFSLPVKTG